MDKISKKPLLKRNYKNKPLESFSKKDWLLKFMDYYRKTYNKEMFGTDLSEGLQTKIKFMSNGIIEAFGKRDWSSYEFDFFLKDQCEQSLKNNFEFKVFTFSTEFCSKRFSYYDRIFKKERQEDFLRKITYHKHYQIRTDKTNDLLEIISYLKDDYVKIIYSFGLPICHKYIQIVFKKTFTEARNLILKTIKEEIVVKMSSEPEMARKYFKTVFENSILYGPYKNKELRSKYIIPENHIYNWREDLDFVWKYFSLDKEPIFEELEKNVYWEMIPQVKNIFVKGLEKIK